MKETATLPVRPATVVLAGNFGVGKTSLFRKLVSQLGQPGQPRGSAVLRLTDGTKIKLLDTCDMERFNNKSLTGSYYREAACVLLVADVTDMRSVQSLQGWKDGAGVYAPYGYGLKALQDRISAACSRHRGSQIRDEAAGSPEGAPHQPVKLHQPAAEGGKAARRFACRC